MIRKAIASDLVSLTDLAILLWPDHTFNDLKQEMDETLSDKNAVFYLYLDGDVPVGFAQCQLRFDYVEGTDSSPVGYLEGIFVTENYRKKGIAKQLVNACEQWSIENGCTEFASDCEITNVESYNFHMKIGFQEEARIICFRKNLEKSEN